MSPPEFALPGSGDSELSLVYTPRNASPIGSRHAWWSPPDRLPTGFSLPTPEWFFYVQAGSPTSRAAKTQPSPMVSRSTALYFVKKGNLSRVYRATNCALLLPWGTCFRQPYLEVWKRQSGETVYSERSQAQATVVREPKSLSKHFCQPQLVNHFCIV